MKWFLGNFYRHLAIFIWSHWSLHLWVVQSKSCLKMFQFEKWAVWVRRNTLHVLTEVRVHQFSAKNRFLRHRQTNFSLKKILNGSSQTQPSKQVASFETTRPVLRLVFDVNCIIINGLGYSWSLIRYLDLFHTYIILTENCDFDILIKVTVKNRS